MMKVATLKEIFIHDGIDIKNAIVQNLLIPSH